MTNAEYANGLRAIADFYEQNPDAVNPGDQMWIFCYDREEFLKAATALSRGGKVEKSLDPPNTIGGADYHAKRQFGAITVDIRIPQKSICRLVRPAEYECPDSLLEEAKEFSEVA